MIDLGALVALRAVDEHGSVVGAAESLGFTPSAVSQQVKRLERQTGIALLERVGRGVVLTGAGRHLVDAGAAALTDLEAVEAGLHRRSGHVVGHLRLAAFSTAVRGLVAGAARDLLAAHPDLRLTIVEQEPWETVDLVAAGRVDVGLVHSWGGAQVEVPDHCVRTPVLADEADVILRHDHHLADRTVLTPRDLADEPWIATSEGTICREWLGRMYAVLDRRPRIAHVSAEFDSHLALAAAGLGIALVPRLGRTPLSPELRAVPVTDPVPTRDVVAVHRRSMGESPAVAAVLAALAG